MASLVDTEPDLKKILDGFPDPLAAIALRHPSLLTTLILISFFSSWLFSPEVKAKAPWLGPLLGLILVAAYALNVFFEKKRRKLLETKAADLPHFSPASYVAALEIGDRWPTVQAALNILIAQGRYEYGTAYIASLQMPEEVERCYTRLEAERETVSRLTEIAHLSGKSNSIQDLVQYGAIISAMVALGIISGIQRVSPNLSSWVYSIPLALLTAVFVLVWRERNRRAKLQANDDEVRALLGRFSYREMEWFTGLAWIGGIASTEIARWKDS